MMSSTNVLLVMFFIFFTYLHFDFAVCSNSRRREIEWKALMDFKGSLVDPYDRLSSWSGQDYCTWHGITCHNRTGFVQMIDLLAVGSCFEGQINSSLLKLEHLEYLDLGYNFFSWTSIPAFLGSLRNLQYLDLREAEFSGEIPPQLGNLSNLQHLYVSGNEAIHMSGICSLSSLSLNWIVGLSSLRSLEFSCINLSKSVDWLDSINKLSSLSSLTISYCGLVGMPLSHDLNLTSLVQIDLRYNSFNSALPPSFFNLTRLEAIRIGKSSLRGPIPDMFQKLTTLKYLDLSVNSFGSLLPDSVCTLSSLTTLDLSASELQGMLPFYLGNLTNLVEFGLDHNQLSGRIPSTLGKLTKLNSLDVSSNYLIGELSESFFQGLISLQNLDVSRNQLMVFNVSPQWIPRFKIQSLNMDSAFIGLMTSFPTWLQTQTNLTSLSLRNASISGAIPDWCQTSYPYLHSFDLSSNFLTGPVPTFNLMSTNSISVLVLSDNRLTGNIPDDLCNLHEMVSLKLANNQLVGRIPSCLGNLGRLVVLDLSNNSFSDRIPNELGSFYSSLSVLRLNGNKLSGELPSSFQNLKNLIILDVGENELQGCVPSWIGKELLNLEHLMLQSNNFSCEISVSLCQLPSLRILNLPNNSLVGTIPPCMGNLGKMQSKDSATDLYSDTLLTIIIKGIELEYSSNLKYVKFISLSGNHLHGKIPDELMNLTGLQSLNLSNNDLTGNIPERIGNMKHLESLDLSTNQLSGAIPQSLAGIDDLGYLNMSFNNLSGRIPSGGHFDTLNNAFVYEGNEELCGKPTTKMCDDDLVPAKQSGHISDGDDDSEIDFDWLYAGIGPGFAVGFLGVFFLLYFQSSWRYRFFTFVEIVYSRF